jgi:hypothetical protein
MDKEKAVIGFIGAGGIARSHAFSLNSLKYYYNEASEIELAAVCSAHQGEQGVICFEVWLRKIM